MLRRGLEGMIVGRMRKEEEMLPCGEMEECSGDGCYIEYLGVAVIASLAQTSLVDLAT